MALDCCFFSSLVLSKEQSIQSNCFPYEILLQSIMAIEDWRKKTPFMPHSHLRAITAPEIHYSCCFCHHRSLLDDSCERKFVNWWMRCSSSPTIFLICGQIQQWEQNLERFNMDLFRMRCYLASLQGSELPNPKSLLATASRPTKTALARLGIFSVSSFHALVSILEHYSYRPLF